MNLKSQSARFKNFFHSSAGRRVFPRAMKNELQFEDELPYQFLLSDGKTIQCRDRQLMQCIRLDGLNAATATDEKIDRVKDLLAAIIGSAEDQFSFYIHKISRKLKWDAYTIESPDFARLCDLSWREQLAANAPRDLTITITVISSPSVLLKIGGLYEKLRAFRSKTAGDADFVAYRSDISQRQSRLNELTGLITSSFSDLNARPLTASRGELLGFLEAIGCGIETKAYPQPGHAVLARSIANYRPTARGNNIIISGGSVSDRYGGIFTIKDYPRVSFAGIFDELRLPVDMVITNSFDGIRDDSAKELMRRNIAQRESVLDVAITDQEQIQIGRDRIASGLEKLGSHHMTVAIYAEDLDVLERASSELRAAAQEAGAKLITEAFASLGHYFAQWPGNKDYRARTAMISNHVFAGIASLHRTPTGLTADELPWGSPITAFPTPDGSLYNFNFHPKGRPDEEPPAAHTIMFGESGSGKTVMINFLVAQAARLGVQTFHFDHLCHAETSIKALHGTYSSISPARPTGLDPLATQTDAEGRAWLNEWLLSILDRKDHQLTPLQRQAIADSVRRNAEAPAELRNFQNFRQLFEHVDDSGDLMQRLAEWCDGGRYGWAFGNNQAEEFSIKNLIMGFDMTYVLDQGHEKEKTAVLGYLFRLIETKLKEKKPTLIIIDEGWNALNTSYFAAKLEKWLFTVRKLNAVVLVATQFPSQLHGSEIRNTMLQGFRTKIILPSKDASTKDYTDLGLSERELNTITGINANPSVRLALIRNDTEKIVVNANLRALGEKLSILGGGPSGEKALAAYLNGNHND